MKVLRCISNRKHTRNEWGKTASRKAPKSKGKGTRREALLG